MSLARRECGTIYLRPKVNGKNIRVSLETSDLRIAKIRRDDRSEAMRTAAGDTAEPAANSQLGGSGSSSLRSTSDPASAQADNDQILPGDGRHLNETLPVTIHARTWTAGEAARWWKRIAAKYAPRRANNILGICKQVGKIVVDAGLLLDDPTEKLKRVKIVQPDIAIPYHIHEHEPARSY